MTPKLSVPSCSRVLLGESEQAHIAEQFCVPPGVCFGVISEFNWRLGRSQVSRWAMGRMLEEHGAESHWRCGRFGPG